VTKAAAAVLRRQLKARGSDRKVADRPATLADIRALARRNGLSSELEKVLAGSGRP